MTKWRLIPKVSYTNYHKQFPNFKWLWTKWFSIDRFWYGKIIEISVKHRVITLDFRQNWLADMADFVK